MSTGTGYSGRLPIEASDTSALAPTAEALA